MSGQSEKAQSKLKEKLPTLLLLLIFLVGLAVALYPAVSDYWNSRRQSRAIVGYKSAISKLSPAEYRAIFDTAHRYNAAIAELEYPLIDFKKLYEREDLPPYNEILNIGTDGVMSYITIPTINCNLAVYHGTSDSVLNVAVGHIEGTSLPVGGSSTHCVLSAHRGLPSAKLFSDLDKLKIGDTFTLTTLDRIFTYEVDRILIVEPDEVEYLYVSEGEDLCTLVTCTPYGINTHRLLVRAHAVDTLPDKSSINVPADAVRIDELIVACIIAALILLLMFLFAGRRKERKS